MGAVNAQLILTNHRSRNLDVYLPDAVGTSIGFTEGSGLCPAGAPTQLVIKDDCVISGMVIGTAPTAVGLCFVRNSQPVVGGTVRYACNTGSASSTPTRTAMRIPLKRGDILTAIQF